MSKKKKQADTTTSSEWHPIVSQLLNTEDTKRTGKTRAGKSGITSVGLGGFGRSQVNSSIFQSLKNTLG